MPERAALEVERDFLLRSIDDLESELAAGNIDPETYRTLHDDYTARAATVIRRLDGASGGDGGDATATGARPARPRWMPVAVGAGIAVFAVGAAFALSSALGTREEGQTITGNAQTGTTVDSLASLQAAVDANPDDYAARIAYCRALLGNDQLEALKQCDAAAALDETKPEPRAYAGWITALAAQDVTDAAPRQVLIDGAFERFAAAVAIDPDYPDTYVFRGLTRLNILGDPAAAVADFQLFLALAPEHPMREMVLGALERAVAESGGTTTTVAGPP